MNDDDPNDARETDDTDRDATMDGLLEPDAGGGSAESRIAELEARLRETEDHWRRAAADLDNYRKRYQRELARAVEIQREELLKPWLEALDNMERALTAEGAQSNPWYEGIEAIHQQMLALLKRFGVEPFEAHGTMFDPVWHEAVATANLPGKPEGLIVDVVQTGYALDGKALRPARVIPVKPG